MLNSLLSNVCFLGSVLAVFLSQRLVQADDSNPENEVIINATFNNVADGLLEQFSLHTNGIGNPAWNNATGQASMATNQNSVGTVGCVSNGSFDGSLQSELTASFTICLLYTSPSPRDRTRSRMPSSA